MQYLFSSVTDLTDYTLSYQIPDCVPADSDLGLKWIVLFHGDGRDITTTAESFFTDISGDYTFDIDATAAISDQVVAGTYTAAQAAATSPAFTSALSAMCWAVCPSFLASLLATSTQPFRTASGVVMGLLLILHLLMRLILIHLLYYHSRYQ